MRRTVGALVALLVASCHGGKAEATDAAPPPAAASSSAAPSEIRYLALGDSFTIGTGSTPAESFPARLAERWRGQGKKVTLQNLGVNGFTTDDLSLRELPRVAPFHPTFVTLAIGANDRVHLTPVAVYRRHLKSILDDLRKAGVTPAQLVALPQPDWSQSPAAAAFGTPEALGADIASFNAALKEEVDAFGARYVDLFPLMHQQAQSKMLAADGLHPNAKAYDEWAAELFKQLP